MTNQYKHSLGKTTHLKEPLCLCSASEFTRSLCRRQQKNGNQPKQFRIGSNQTTNDNNTCVRSIEMWALNRNCASASAKVSCRLSLRGQYRTLLETESKADGKRFALNELDVGAYSLAASEVLDAGCLMRVPFIYTGTDSSVCVRARPQLSQRYAVCHCWPDLGRMSAGSLWH